MTVWEDIEEIVNNKELIASFAKKRILVTGATGLIGSMIIKALVRANEKYDLGIVVIGQARNEEKAKAILGEVSKRVLLYNPQKQEIKCDFIFHTASPTASKFFIDHPVETIDGMLSGMKQMLELSRKNGATLVYLSSMEEYGVPYEIGEVMTEEKVGIIDHLTPRSCYPEGKRMCECMCMAYFSEYNTKVKIVRLAQTFGAGVPLSDNRMPMQFAKSALNKTDIVLHTKGESVSNFCYLTDAVTGIFTVAIRGTSGNAYNICNDQETRTIMETANLVAEDICKGEISVVICIDEKKGYAPINSMRLSSMKLKDLSWIPHVDLRTGYIRLISYLKESITQEE